MSKFDDQVQQIASTLTTNDKLYDVCDKFVQLSKKASKLDALAMSVMYNTIEYTFRKAQLDKLTLDHGTFYNAIYEPMMCALYKCFTARDRLMSYCDAKNVNYDEFLSNFVIY